MRRAFAFATVTGLILATAACATVANLSDDDVFRRAKPMRLAVGDVRVEGVYRYIDGDRLVSTCRGQPCVATLVRDDHLQRRAHQLNGSRIGLIVRQVDACKDKDSSAIACLNSGDGTALVIVKWVHTPF